jgi:hypothetical protein
MGGLIGTGLGYEKTAMSGMIRESAEQQKRDMAEQNLKAQKDMQETQMIGQAAGLAISTALLFVALA